MRLLKNNSVYSIDIAYLIHRDDAPVLDAWLHLSRYLHIKKTPRLSQYKLRILHEFQNIGRCKLMQYWGATFLIHEAILVFYFVS